MRRLASILGLVAGLALPGLWPPAATVAGDKAGTAKAIIPFNGKDLTGWKLKGDAKRSHWTVGTARLSGDNDTQFKVTKDKEKPGEPGRKEDLVNARSGGVDIYTEEKFGDAIIEVEFMVPKNSNSGVYVMGEYEIQVLDSYGREKLGGGDLGAIYSAAVPKINAAKKPGEWQKFEIHFQAPRFDGGKKTSNAKFLKVILNDQTIHENVEMKGPTPSGVTGKEAATGPLMFQGDHGPVAFRNIRIRPLGGK
jgi:hypothetical protein